MKAIYKIKAPKELRAFRGSLAFEKFDWEVERLMKEWEQMIKDGTDNTFLVQIEDNITTAGLYVYYGCKKKKVCAIRTQLIPDIMRRIYRWRKIA